MSTSVGPGLSRARPKLGSPADIQSTIPQPGTIKINVEGAFIVDDEPALPADEDAEDIEYVHDTEDIRLPNHTAVVSHIAVDVSVPRARTPWSDPFEMLGRN